MVLKVGILTRNREAWCSRELYRAMEKGNIKPIFLEFPRITARVKSEPKVTFGHYDLTRDTDAIIVRPIGRGSLEEIIFRMDLLYRLKRQGIFVINDPQAIEKAVDKYRALTILEEMGMPVPRTAVTENPGQALNAFHELGGDVVVKSIFGSRGMGMTRVTDPEAAMRVFQTLAFYHHVLYLQEFVPHGTSDIRAFVLGSEVIASMRRVGTGWKSNVAQGATPVPYELGHELREMVIKATEILGCEMAGVDIIEGSDASLITEINSQPGWRGLQSTTETNIAEEIVNYILRRLRS
ncbi:MAG: RimK family alpha-L-glutamate ligase [Candidatus Bathyarchaeia archaeon]